MLYSIFFYLFLFDVGDDSRLNPFEERGDDAFLCSSPSLGVVIKLVYNLIALEQVFHCDKLIQISTNLG